ncbi:hypothetical protein [Cellulomonas fengjieae]|uniref:Uncharacterized protein n=1 Tax=Cellulomonas fengjieae TaxID=2819978 RepID=A0ABS3SD67_9CELL|nr:hypothetical protein [Cellulomonas fengjieae]MBO3083694.1 hypothetical protein [Cellulomonas fengjieae]QVI65000.1 hypothetical protein KG102_12725 [Cellulomonas fengjieae]
MRTTPVVTAITSGAVALALLSGCGAGGGEGPSDDATLTYRDSPLTKYWEAMGGSQDESAADAQAARSEEIVAACMQDEGFEYTPQDTSGMNRSLEGGDGDMPAWDTLEFAQQYGYGATTWEDLPVNEGADEYVDANADYVASMSESEQEAFYAALYGAQVVSEEPIDAEAELPEYDWTTGGCQGKAQHEVYEGSQIWDDPEFKDLADEMSTLYTDSQTDERMVEAHAEWAKCMADEGYDFANPQEAQQSIFDLMEAIPYDEETGMQDEAALDEITEQELATATADRICQDSTRAGQAALEAQFAIEQEFIDANKERLDAMVEKAAQASE